MKPIIKVRKAAHWKPYTNRRLREMRPESLWTELAIHRGLIAEEEVTKRGHDGDFVDVLSFYNIGSDTDIGMSDRAGRRVLHRTHLMRRPWFDEWDLSDKHGRLQGPALSEHTSIQSANRLRFLAADALEKIKAGIHRKPGLPGQPARGKPVLGKIAYEDRPDVGHPKSKPFMPVRLSSTKPKLRLKKPELKVKRSGLHIRGEE